MINIDGIDYEQPTDKAIVAYNGSKYVLVSDGNTLQRVLMSEFASLPHDHDNETLRPYNIQPPVGSASNQIRIGDSSYGSFLISGGSLYFTAQSSGIIVAKADQGLLIQNHSGSGWTLDVWGTGGTGYATSDGWYLNPCSEALKENIQEIPDTTVDVLDTVRGITYTQEGKPGVGISAEDLDKFHLPNLTRKRPDGTYMGINPAGLIPLLVQSQKRLRSRIRTLMGLLASLESRIEELERNNV